MALSLGGRNVPVALQEQLFAELDMAMSSLPAARPLDWRGRSARGGTPCGLASGSSAAPRKPRIEYVSTVSGTANAPSSQSAPEPGRYWAEVTKIAGSEAASCVQRWLMRYVEGLSMDEIELLATPPKTAT
jgi:nucleoid-associated protein YgaU